MLASAVSLLVLTFVFALFYKYVPDAAIGWRDVWLGGLLTAVLFTLGKTAIGVYLGQASVGSAYGAAGSMVVPSSGSIIQPSSCSSVPSSRRPGPHAMAACPRPMPCPGPRPRPKARQPPTAPRGRERSPGVSRCGRTVRTRSSPRRLQESVTSVDPEGGMVASAAPLVRVMAASRVLALARFFAMVSLTESQFAVPILPRGL